MAIQLQQHRSSAAQTSAVQPRINYPRTPLCGPSCLDERLTDWFGNRLEWVNHDPRVHERGGPGPIECGPLVIDVDREVATLRGQVLRLTRMSFRVLAAVASRRGQTARHDEIVREVWGDDHWTPRVRLADGSRADLHLLRVNAARIRTAMGNDAGMFGTVVGVGYRLDLNPPPRRDGGSCDPMSIGARTGAARLGITPEEFAARRAAGERWCSGHRAWEDAGAFYSNDVGTCRTGAAAGHRRRREQGS